MTAAHHLVPTPAASAWADLIKPWPKLMPRTGRTPAEKSLNNRAGQIHSKRKDRGTGRGDNDSHQADRLPGIMLQEDKKWVRRMGNLWRKKCERLKDRKLYQGLSHAHSRNHEHEWKHQVVLSGAVSFGLSCQGTLKQGLVGPHKQKTDRVISAPGTVLIKLEMESHYQRCPSYDADPPLESQSFVIIAKRRKWMNFKKSCQHIKS